MKALTDEESDAAQMTFPAYVHGMLKMESFAGAIRPDQEKAQVVVRVPGRAQAGAVAARSAVFAHPGRRPGRRPPLPRRLPVRLHRADLEPVPADGHHPEGLDQPRARPEGDPRTSTPISTPSSSAMRASGPRSGRATSTTRSSTRPRSPGWPPPGIERLADMQLSDGGWGWFSGFGEYRCHRTRRPWSSTACKSPARTT